MMNEIVILLSILIFLVGCLVLYLILLYYRANKTRKMVEKSQWQQHVDYFDIQQKLLKMERLINRRLPRDSANPDDYHLKDIRNTHKKSGGSCMSVELDELPRGTILDKDMFYSIPGTGGSTYRVPINHNVWVRDDNPVNSVGGIPVNSVGGRLGISGPRDFKEE